MKIIIKYDEDAISGAEKMELDNTIMPSVVKWVQSESNKVVACNFKTEVATYWAYKYETKNGTKVINIEMEEK